MEKFLGTSLRILQFLSNSSKENLSHMTSLVNKK